jgi:hypothetical protein
VRRSRPHEEDRKFLRVVATRSFDELVRMAHQRKYGSGWKRMAIARALQRLAQKESERDA